ncbi:MBL fold metallo-hydrolase [Gorillibacterium massiliense]|uniref:MBL fold metallo-hydrolase n=1 Tax=Gorillibacterium massiliense TaxID=1280390 RepID=UPI0004B4DA34|nr:MBL fold metallo-hydrolase [Gorillibacterium massiliense]
MPTAFGVLPLVLDMNAGNGNKMTAHASLLWDDQDVFLVDTGIVGQLDVIRKAMASAGFPFEKLTGVILTHQDRDHIGGLPELLEAKSGSLKVLAHELALPYLAGEIPLVKSGATVKPPLQVDQILQDGDELSLAGGVIVIHTPGHTPDHICLYHKPSRTLISGDALIAENGVLLPPDPQFTPAYEQALSSVAKLCDLEVDTVIAYHGGVCTELVAERLASIAQRQD